MTLLGFERGEAAATVPIRYQAELDRLFALARERGVADDPIIRQRLAWAYSKVQIMRYNGMRVLTRFLEGHHPGPDAAIGKLYWSEYHKIVTELAVDILGADALAPTGRGPSTAFQTDDAGRAELVELVGRHVPQRPRRHDLRRLVAGAAQHHRRDGARACRRSRDRREHRPRRHGSDRRRGRAPAVALADRGCARSRRTAAPGWWRRPPFLPVPTAEYLHFRMVTQYGETDRPPHPGDVVDYLAWCRGWERSL